MYELKPTSRKDYVSFVASTFLYNKDIKMQYKFAEQHQPEVKLEPMNRIKVQISNLEVTDLVRAAARQDPLRANPVTKRLLECPWEDLRKEVDDYMMALNPDELVRPDSEYYAPVTVEATMLTRGEDIAEIKAN